MKHGLGAVVAITIFAACAYEARASTVENLESECTTYCPCGVVVDSSRHHDALDVYKVRGTDVLGWRYLPWYRRARRIGSYPLDIACFSKEPSASTELVANEDGSEVLAVNEGGETIVVFSRNAITGELTYGGHRRFHDIRQRERTISPLRLNWHSDRTAEIGTLQSVCPGAGER